MKNKKNLLVMVVAIFIFSSCSTTKSLPLDLETLENREFKIQSIIMTEFQDKDPDFELLSYISDEFLTELSKIKETMWEDYEIILNDSDFLNSLKNGTLEVETDVLMFNIRINSYIWRVPGKSDQSATIGVPRKINEDNTMLFSITLYKSNPVNPESIYKETIYLNIEME
ncbi:MAG: hypothetical protein PF518_19495 [Spirochaetaceae bacterium]|jgi:hypothetical protein|nr:hypothetical protein [Spirochaetaceae bacterium]